MSWKRKDPTRPSERKLYAWPPSELSPSRGPCGAMHTLDGTYNLQAVTPATRAALPRPARVMSVTQGSFQAAVILLSGPHLPPLQCLVLCIPSAGPICRLNDSPMNATVRDSGRRCDSDIHPGPFVPVAADPTIMMMDCQYVRTYSSPRLHAPSISSHRHL